MVVTARPYTELPLYAVFNFAGSSFYLCSCARRELQVVAANASRTRVVPDNIMHSFLIRLG